MTNEEPVHASVLIVEDEGIVAQDLQETLNAMGYDAYAVAASAQEALDRAKEHRPDLVLMDVRISGPLDGVATAALLRQEYDVPVVYLTAHSDELTLGRAKQTGPYGFLVKPVKTAELRCTIEVSLSRHDMERRLREREAWYGTTLDALADGVVSVDPNVRVTYMNPAAEKLTGLRAVDILGRTAREALPHDPPLDEAQSLPLEETIRRRAVVGPVDARLRRRDETLRYVSETTSPVVDRGNLRGAVMVMRDTTEERALRETLTAMERLNSLAKMSAGLAHEVNNPLQVVFFSCSTVGRLLSETRLLLDRTPPDLEGARDRLHQIDELEQDTKAAAERVRAVVEDLQVVAAPRKPITARCDVKLAIQVALKSCVRELGEIEVRVHAEDAAPKAIADEKQLVQVLVNLITNAAHALHEHPVPQPVIEVRVWAPDSGRVAIAVQDNGPGIDLEVQRRLFEPFFTTRQDVGGTGLGLAISRGLVVSFGGELSMNSVKGAGATFRVVLLTAR